MLVLVQTRLYNSWDGDVFRGPQTKHGPSPFVASDVQSRPGLGKLSAYHCAQALFPPPPCPRTYGVVTAKRVVAG